MAGGAMTNVVPAIISGVVALGVAYVGIFATARQQKEQTERQLTAQREQTERELKLQEERLTADARRQEERLTADARRQKEQTAHELKLQEERLRAELRTEFMAETAIRQLLNHPAWKRRSFRAIKRKMGGSPTGAAFEDNELRKLLIRSGAVCFWHGQSGQEEEYWGLIEKNQDKLNRSPAGAAGED
jgi:hypothetical protein